MALFNRQDKQVIKDAQELTVEDFVKKYKPLTGEELLSKAYLEIRKANPVPAAPVEKMEVDDVVRPKINKVFSKVLSKPVVKPAVEEENDEFDVAIGLKDGEEWDDKKLDEVKDFVSKSRDVKAEKESPVKERVKLRTQRIKELLEAKVKPKDIITTLAAEGISCHLPQITAVKQAKDNDSEK